MTDNENCQQYSFKDIKNLNGIGSKLIMKKDNLM